MTDDADQTSESDEQTEPWSPAEGEWTTVRSALGLNIRRIRTEHGWTQERLAEAMEYAGFEWSRVTVAQSENEPSESGRSRRITIEELVGLAFVLRTTVLDLFGPGPIEIGNQFMNRDDLLVHFVGGTDALAPEELTLLTRRALTEAEIRRLAAERASLTIQIEEIRSNKEDQ